MTLSVLFGANVDPVWSDPGSALRLTRAAEHAGLDLVTVQDHPYQPAFYDTWTLISHLAGGTRRIALVPTVSCLPLRPPAMLAKAAASLDVLTGGGRVQLGLGAGGFWDGIAAMDGPRRTPAEAIRALGEAVDVVRQMWSGERSVRYAGDYYGLHGVHPGPRPGAGLGIWLGVYGRQGLALVGAKADGWIPSYAYLGLDKLADAVARVDDAAAGAGRDPQQIRKVYNVGGVIGGRSGQLFEGAARDWADQLAAVVHRYGMNGFAFWPAEDHERQIALFGQEVVPMTRDLLAG